MLPTLATLMASVALWYLYLIGESRKSEVRSTTQGLALATSSYFFIGAFFIIRDCSIGCAKGCEEDYLYVPPLAMLPIMAHIGLLLFPVIGLLISDHKDARYLCLSMIIPFATGVVIRCVVSDVLCRKKILFENGDLSALGTSLLI